MMNFRKKRTPVIPMLSHPDTILPIADDDEQPVSPESPEAVIVDDDIPDVAECSS